QGWRGRSGTLSGANRVRARAGDVPEPDTDGSVMIMNNPLELTGPWRHVGHPVSGRLLIVGARRDSRRLARCLKLGPWAGLPDVGFIDAGHPPYQHAMTRRSQT